MKNMQASYAIYESRPVSPARVFVTHFMAVQIGDYEFSGPYRDWTLLLEESGVFAILGGSGVGDWAVVDIDHAENVRKRVESHERSAQWRACNHLMLVVAVLYVPAPDRMIIENELRNQYNPPCGSR